MYINIQGERVSGEEVMSKNYRHCCEPIYCGQVDLMAIQSSPQDQSPTITLNWHVNNVAIFIHLIFQNLQAEPAPQRHLPFRSKKYKINLNF